MQSSDDASCAVMVRCCALRFFASLSFYFSFAAIAELQTQTFIPLALRDRSSLQHCSLESAEKGGFLQLHYEIYSRKVNGNCSVVWLFRISLYGQFWPDEALAIYPICILEPQWWQTQETGSFLPCTQFKCPYTCSTCLCDSR